MKRSLRPVTAAALTAFLLAACGSETPSEPADAATEQSPEPTEDLSTEETQEPEGPTTEAPDDDAGEVDETEDPSEGPEELPAAEPGLLMVDLQEDVTRTGLVDVEAGTFGTPGGLFEIRSVAKAESLPGMLVGGPEATYRPADGEEFFVVDTSFALNEDRQPPGAELFIDSQGSRRLVAALRQGESTFLASLPAGGEGTTLVVSSDGKNQVFDLAEGAREDDPLTDVFLRRVVRQDLTEVLTFDPVAGHDRQFTADVRLRSARITPYVPTQVGDQRWAEPGTMWVVVEFETSYDATRAGWAKKRATTSWSVEGSQPVVVQDRNAGQHFAVLNAPADAEEVEITVGATMEVSELSGGDTVKDFGTETFTVTFPDDD